jgi:hypothetical protein
MNLRLLILLRLKRRQNRKKRCRIIGAAGSLAIVTGQRAARIA